MRFSLTCAALAGVAAAGPGSPLRQRTAAERAVASRLHRSSERIANSFKMSDESGQPQYSTNWAGAVQHSTGITKATGSIKVPEASGGDRSQSGAAWVGIDGDSCQGGLLQTGIDFYGDGSYDAWYEWYPANVVFFDNFPLSIGDAIYMEVDASSLTTGTAILKNLATGHQATHTFKNPVKPLCETDADWILEQFDSKLAGFSEIIFTNNTAVTSQGTITPRGGQVLDLKAGSVIKTDCGIDGDDVYCKYLGHE
ncbi:hypothetical protein NLG97_g395 [Lecanicillium saksenae]|uniref:Uncharacterized protein n=1 Tax=Lecanicillium saksenae TaxID=468837 RepID=A0ACC1R6P0_9HYPO|nr:hypothetical protein NLG97_g395 [Lecanicillium saksenae]